MMSSKITNTSYSLFGPFDYFIGLGRLMFASLFLLGGVNKIANFSTVAERMTDVGMPSASVLLICVISLELVGGFIVAAGPTWFRPKIFALACFSLMLFTLATNGVFHRFWELNGPVRDLELSLFFKNISIAGGLLFLGASALSGQPDNHKDDYP